PLGSSAPNVPLFLLRPVPVRFHPRSPNRNHSQAKHPARSQTLAMATGAAAKTPTKPSAPAAPKTPAKPAPSTTAAAAAKTPAKPPSSVATAKTPARSVSRARFAHASENSDPNILASPPRTTSKTPAKPAAAPAVSASVRKKRGTPAPPPPVPQRRFLVAKKGAHRRRQAGASGGGGEFDFDKCREAAREALRASHEEFFLKERAVSAASEEQESQKEEEAAEDEANSAAVVEEGEGAEVADLEGSGKVRAIRSRVMAKAMNSVPDAGAGRVKHLVHAFESLLSISGATADSERAGEEAWALPGLQPWNEGSEGSPVAVFSSSDFMNMGPTRLCSSLDGKSNRSSWDSQTGGRRSRRNSSESLRSSWNKKLKVTSQHPFKLRTEQRGRAKEQQFIQKVQEMLIEDEKKRIHIAQGLPWTTDEPEVCHYIQPNFL
uniref:TPX2 C-terminal domain-containing protein n=1 Tax=Aegilops tauschii subsp. strangulata TaxID=200361 RepID=A0A453IN61_AEGTS